MPESRNSDKTNSYHNIEGNGKFKERKLKESSSPFPTVMCNIDGPIISHKNCQHNPQKGLNCCFV